MCERGHEWQTTICHRVYKVRHCPHCRFDTLAETYPELASQWDFNNDQSPNQVAAHSRYAATWRCAQGHSWQAPVYRRTLGMGCPYCTNRKTKASFNSLALLHPEIADEWNYDRNAFTPYEVSRGSKKYAWWKCPYGHEWRARIDARTSRNTGCPTCYHLKQQQLTSTYRKQS
ncbi:hypothetical protein BGC07_16020 [Piscirickettsia litoralis]|uniref:Treble clef zinc finger domain-containing protein n=1 Tax=Piscirickettsia litoralis TaxID=1891921 RepID=A0ABX3A005_9GAMM|nr:hypothetical protein BGC07_16020 [Piscirickettsia litoralis]